MYRTLCKQGTLTEYSSGPPQYPAGLPLSNHQRREAHEVHSAIHFRTTGAATLSDSIIAEPFVFIPAEQSQTEFVVPGGSDATLAASTKSRVMPGYPMSWHRYDPGVRVLE